MIKAVFFDVDGTLLDSKGPIAEAVNEAFADVGVEPVAPEYFWGLLKKGLGMKYHLAEVVKKPQLYEKARDALLRHYPEKTGEIRAFEGVEGLLANLKERGIRTGIFTSQHAQMLRATLERFSLPVDAALSRDDVEKGKPAPDQVMLLCKKLSVEPGKALAVGDWTGDIQAGKGAGTKTAGVLTGLCSREELEESGPDYIFEDVRGIMDVV